MSGDLISLVVLGHAQHGKSTTIGHLLHETGAVSQGELSKHEREAVELGRPASKFALIVDAINVERERGMTVDLKLWKLSTHKNEFTVIDTPGHRDYIKNTMTGLAQADAALLVVDATPSAYETGISREGQTRDLLTAAFTLSIKQIIVAVNKMDGVGYSEERYQEIRSQLSSHLKKVGFKSKYIMFVPISGYEGDNLVQRSENMPWYEESTLLEALDGISRPKRLVDKPLRIPLQDVYKIGGIGTVPVGRVETGTLRPGMTVQFAPSGIKAEVVSCEVHHETSLEVGPGLNVGFNVKGVSTKDIARGEVASNADDNPAYAVSSFEAQIVVMNHPGKIEVGYAPVIDIHTAHVACRFAEIKAKLDRKTGKIVENNPKFLQNGEAGVCVLEPSRPLCCEACSEFPPLGRFVVRDSRTTVAVGMIISTKKVTDSNHI